MIKTQLHYDELEDKLIIAREQDVEAILNANKRKFNDANTTWAGGIGDEVADIPLIVIEEFLKKGINLLTDEKELRKFLNNPDYAYCRTRPGRV